MLAKIARMLSGPKMSVTVVTQSGGHGGPPCEHVPDPALARAITTTAPEAAPSRKNDRGLTLPWILTGLRSR